MADLIYMPVKCAWGNNCVNENSDMLVPLGKSCLIVTGKNSA